LVVYLTVKSIKDSEFFYIEIKETRSAVLKKRGVFNNKGHIEKVFKCFCSVCVVHFNNNFIFSKSFKGVKSPLDSAVSLISDNYTLGIFHKNRECKI
jgi:hypothetical protein